MKYFVFRILVGETTGTVGIVSNNYGAAIQLLCCLYHFTELVYEEELSPKQAYYRTQFYWRN